MRTTITIRTDDELRDALTERSRALGIGVSELVRNILHEALAESPVGARIGHLQGRLRLKRKPAEPLRVRLLKHNWRP